MDVKDRNMTDILSTMRIYLSQLIDSSKSEKKHLTLSQLAKATDVPEAKVNQVNCAALFKGDFFFNRV